MLIFLYGPDDYRARQKINELRDKYLKDIDPDGSSVLALDGAKTTIEEIAEIYRPASLFARRRFLVIENIMTNKRKEFVEELDAFIGDEEKNDNILVIYEPGFIEKKLGGKNLIMKPGADDKAVPLNKAEKKLYDRMLKGAFVQAFMPQTPAETMKTLATIAQKNGAALSVPAAQLLMRYLGTDLWPLASEVAKLAAYAQARGADTISEADVKLLVSQSLTDSIFSLTDALGQRQNGLALELLMKQLESGAAPQYLLTMMLWQFKTLASVRQGLDSGASQKDLAKLLGLHPYVLEKSINQVRKFNLAALSTAIDRLVELDFKTKTGQGKLEELLPVTVATL